MLIQSKSRGYVISTCYVIHSHRTYSHHEYAVETALELLEKVAIKALSMSHCMIYSLTMLIQDIICEVVILVNDKIGLDVVCLKFLMNIVHTVACRFLLLVFNNIAFGIILGIARNEITIHHIEIPIDIIFNSILVASWLREVKPQHLVFITLWGRMASHVCVSKQKVKFVLGLDVIIRLHHRQEETLAEATWTY